MLKLANTLKALFVGGLWLISLCLPSVQANNSNIESILNNPLGNISQDVWQRATTSYLSKCKGNCPCALVVAEGVNGQNTTAKMWIGTFKGGAPVELWAGYSSRLANAGQNDDSVNMDTNLCKRRNGVANVTQGQCCIPGRKCRDCGVYKEIAQDLGLPSNVELTSFYFSTPMQNETYKFHDFYACARPPCPATLGCLGLERHAMKALCLNHMGSDGSNGVRAPEQGGAWLYFHNLNPPPGSGSQQDAQAGLERLARGEICSGTSTTHLASGATMQAGNYNINPQSSDNNYSSNDSNGYSNNNSYHSNPSNSGGNSYATSNSGTGDQAGSGGSGSSFMEAAPAAAGVVAGAAYADGSGDQLNAAEPAPQNRGYCRTSITEACVKRTTTEIDQYCSQPAAYKRVGCTFTYIGEGESQ